MKKVKQFTGLFLMSTLFLTSCGSEENEKEVDSETQDSQTEVKEESVSSGVIYSAPSDWDAFIQDVDLSSLCFTGGKQPEYKISYPGVLSCQFKIANTTSLESLEFKVVFKDYANYDAEKIEMDQYLTKSSAKKMSKINYEDSKEVDLGDLAYIGYNALSEAKSKALSIILNNVTINIRADFDENQTCLSSDEELMKLAELVLEKIKR